MYSLPEINSILQEKRDIIKKFISSLHSDTPFIKEENNLLYFDDSQFSGDIISVDPTSISDLTNFIDDYRLFISFFKELKIEPLTFFPSIEEALISFSHDVVFPTDIQEYIPRLTDFDDNYYIIAFLPEDNNESNSVYKLKSSHKLYFYNQVNSSNKYNFSSTDFIQEDINLYFRAILLSYIFLSPFYKH